MCLLQKTETANWKFMRSSLADGPEQLETFKLEKSSDNANRKAYNRYSQMWDHSRATKNTSNGEKDSEPPYFQVQDNRGNESYYCEIDNLNPSHNALLDLPEIDYYDDSMVVQQSRF